MLYSFELKVRTFKLWLDSHGNQNLHGRVNQQVKYFPTRLEIISTGRARATEKPPARRSRGRNIDLVALLTFHVAKF